MHESLTSQSLFESHGEGTLLTFTHTPISVFLPHRVWRERDRKAHRDDGEGGLVRHHTTKVQTIQVRVMEQAELLTDDTHHVEQTIIIAKPT